jgi:hypothetical protein
MLLLQSDVANLWSWLTTLTTVIGGLATPFVAWYLMKHTRQQTVQALQTDRIETLVNGNLHREQEETKRLRALLEQHGIDSDSGQTNNS